MLKTVFPLHFVQVPASSFLTRTCLVTVGLVTHASRPGSTRWKSLEFDWDNLLELWLDTQIAASNDLMRVCVYEDTDHDSRKNVSLSRNNVSLCKVFEFFLLS